MRAWRRSLYAGGVLALSLVAGACGGDEGPLTRSHEAGNITNIIRSQEGAASANHRTPLSRGDDRFRTFLHDQFARGYLSGRFGWTCALVSGTSEQGRRPFVDCDVAGWLS